jgi:YD repeat-containing protein
MKYTIIGLALLLASPALAQEAVRKFYDAKGQVVGSSITHGDGTTYFNEKGQVTGSSTTRGDRTQYYNSSGQQTGSSTTPRTRSRSN